MATTNGSDDGNHRATESALIFLGTGCSSMVPNVMCLIQPSDPPCPVCVQSLSLPPERNPNYRCNTSLLIDYCESNGNRTGKMSRQIAIGLLYNLIPWGHSVKTHKIITAAMLRFREFYILPGKKKKLKEGQEIRRVAQMAWNIIADDCTRPFLASGLKFTPLPVMHGEDYICLGFLFGEKTRVAYISDVSRIPASTEHVISKSGAGQLDLLILDSLYRTGSHNVHLCFPQTLETVKRLCPKQTLLIGMTHEFDHHRDNEFLTEWSRREGIPVQLAHDGLRVPINL
ncbi:Ribonuclease Z/Hydroxyacylglutathione hydrolase-like [Sesbania bispinosa]|nr:Ribonuclease Z/Hydroxyacylglutathione hydrolase-like [Sesbania bispinosa]